MATAVWDLKTPWKDFSFIECWVEQAMKEDEGAFSVPTCAIFLV